MTTDRIIVWITVTIIAIGFLTICVASCDEAVHVPPSGVVSVRGHQSHWVQFVTVGKVTTQIHHPERWWLVLLDDHGEKQVVNVGEDVWESVEVGDYYAQGAADASEKQR